MFDIFRRGPSILHGDFNNIECEGRVDFLTDVLRDKKPRGDDCQHQEVRGDMVAGKPGDDGLQPARGQGALIRRGHGM